jgi:hypothetical protein
VSGVGSPELALRSAETAPALELALLFGFVVTAATEPRFVPLTPRLTTVRTFTL